MNPQTSSHPQLRGPGELNLEPDSGVRPVWRNGGPSYLEVLQPLPEGCTPPSPLAWGEAAWCRVVYVGRLAWSDSTPSSTASIPLWLAHPVLFLPLRGG